MLTEEEEGRVNLVIDICKDGRLEMKPSGIQWIAEKLIEINNEASKYAEELQTTNEQLARVMEHYEG